MIGNNMRARRLLNSIKENYYYKTIYIFIKNIKIKKFNNIMNSKNL